MATAGSELYSNSSSSEQAAEPLLAMVGTWEREGGGGRWEVGVRCRALRSG
jgi:hypothetical protein